MRARVVKVVTGSQLWFEGELVVEVTTFVDAYDLIVYFLIARTVLGL